jgi:hypothetical protein
MEAQTLAAIYAMAVVLLVAGQWIASLARGKVPELVTKPWEIRTHITAEALMALTLLGGGLATLVGVAGGRPFLIPRPRDDPVLDRDELRLLPAAPAASTAGRVQRPVVADRDRRWIADRLVGRRT